VRKLEEWEEKMFCRTGGTLGAAEETDALGFISREESVRAWLTAIGCKRRVGSCRATAEQRVTTADLEELREFLDENAICVSLPVFRPLRAFRGPRNHRELHCAHLRPDRRRQGLLQHGPRQFLKSTCRPVSTPPCRCSLADGECRNRARLSARSARISAYSAS